MGKIRNRYIGPRWHHLGAIIWENHHDMIKLVEAPVIIKDKTPRARTILLLEQPTIWTTFLTFRCGWFWCQYPMNIVFSGRSCDTVFSWRVSPLLNCCLPLVEHPGNYWHFPGFLNLPTLFGKFAVTTRISWSSWEWDVGG